MCNRHVAHMIADYEAARLEADEESESRDAEQTAGEQPGLLTTLRSRLHR